MKELAFASACHLAALIRQREIGCLELLDYFIARVERLDETLNAHRTSERQFRATARLELTAVNSQI